MLAGSVRCHADTLAGVMHHHFFTPVPDLGLVRDDVPEPLDAVVRRALHKDAERRFETTREMLTAIEATPFNERDRLESERILQHLVQGRTVPKIAMRALPPLADMPTLAMEARAPGPTQPRPRFSAGRLAGLAGGGPLGLRSIFRCRRSSPPPYAPGYPRPGSGGGGAAPPAPPPSASPRAGR